LINANPFCPEALEFVKPIQNKRSMSGGFVMIGVRPLRWRDIPDSPMTASRRRRCGQRISFGLAAWFFGVMSVASQWMMFKVPEACPMRYGWPGRNVSLGLIYGWPLKP